MSQYSFGGSAAFGVAAWGAGVVIVRALRPYGFLDKSVGPTGLRLAIAAAIAPPTQLLMDAIVHGGKAVTRGVKTEAMAVAVATALVCDGLVFTFGPELYTSDVQQATAGTILLAAGLGILYSFV
jgi:hypothetical protein